MENFKQNLNPSYTSAIIEFKNLKIQKQMTRPVYTYSCYITV